MSSSLMSRCMLSPVGKFDNIVRLDDTDSGSDQDHFCCLKSVHCCLQRGGQVFNDLDVFVVFDHHVTFSSDMAPGCQVDSVDGS
jgi:hypothetical protein